MFTVAVVGGGAAGMGAARRLVQAGVRVQLFEAAPQLGGNCVGVRVPDADGEPIDIDLGVSDFNAVTFREFAALIAELGLETKPIGADAHFATLEGETLAAVQQGRFTRLPRLAGAEQLEQEVDRFRERAVDLLEDARTQSWTLARALQHLGASEAFRHAYLLPRAMGCFPMPNTAPENYELHALLRFWKVHGLIGRERGDRRCIVGGMHRYPRAFAAWFERVGGELHLSTRVLAVERSLRRVSIVTEDRLGRRRLVCADALILACDPAAASRILSDASRTESTSIRTIPMQRARIVVHRDTSFLAREEALWGAYHYVAPQGELPRVRPTITFHPQHLAGLRANCAGISVSMNPHREPRRESVLVERSFWHPIGGAYAERHAAALEMTQGVRQTWFAGAHLRNPYVHEPALCSGIAVAEEILARIEGRTPALARGA